MNSFNTDLSGLYLVVDPMMDQQQLLGKVEQALQGGTQLLQIWNHWPADMSRPDKEQLITFIKELAAGYEVPVLINEEWELLKTTRLDGVHFDAVPDNFDRIKKEVDRPFVAGITCSNNLETVKWADEQGLDYISFCAMFPSPSVGSCEIVQPETVRDAREITDLPLFLSGGMSPEKVAELDDLDFEGVAVISGILKDDSPRRQATKFNNALRNK